MHAVALKSPVNFVLTDTEARPLRSLGVDRSHELNIASLLCVVLLVCYPLKAPETITTDKIKVAPLQENGEHKAEKRKVTNKELRFSSLPSATSQQVDTKHRKTHTGKDQRVMRTCKCMPTEDSHTHLHGLGGSREQKKDTVTHKHAH